MKIRFLLLGTSLSFIPQTINAQCVATQDCATLGYTETSCSGGTGVKCPFGNKWACFKSESEIKGQLCTEMGFTQTCSGTNQIGVGTPCNGKYSECTCASEYEWKDGSCKIQDGAHGDLYYCNGTVVGVKASDMNFYVAMKDLGEKNWNSAYSSSSNYSFCDNVKSSLPTKDNLLSIYKNKSTINSLLSTNDGTQLTEGWYWSSTLYHDTLGYYSINMSNGSTNRSSYGTIHNVRPVLTSW